MDNNQTPPPQPTPEQAPPPVNPGNISSQDMSHDTKTLIVILLLVFAYGIGLIFMWWWMKTWPNWLKILLTLPIFASILLAVFIIFVVVSAPSQPSENTDRTVNEQVIESPTPTVDIQTPTLEPTVVQGVIQTSMSSKNYESLIPYMAESVQFEIESAGGIPPGTPEETVENMTYLDSATPPWDFDQMNDIVTQIKEENPEEYGELFIGISSNEYMVAFGYDENGNINIIKAAVTYKLLITE